jgi:hypothetical protein
MHSAAMSHIENSSNADALWRSLLDKGVDPDLFLKHFENDLKEAMQKKRSELCSARTAPRPPPRRPPQQTTGVVGKMPWGEQEQYSFQVHGNNGGARGVDCGILALKKAMALLRDCPEGLAQTFFAGSPEEIREELVSMFLQLDGEQQLHMARQYVETETLLNAAHTQLGSEDNAALDSVREQTIRHLRREMLNWHTLVLYIQLTYPGQINAAIWKQQPTGDVALYEAGTDIIPDRPVLHIIHYNALHFEALDPFEVDAVECAIKGRVDDAAEYMIENFAGGMVPLFVASHPLERGQMLVLYESAVYKCESGHAIMRSLGGITPMSKKESCSFNYLGSKPVPESLVESIGDFVMMQGLGAMGF